jgi:Transposase DDE domain
LSIWGRHDEGELEALKAAAQQRSRSASWSSAWVWSPRAAGRCRSRLPGWGTCWMPWSMLAGCWGLRTRQAGTRCSPSGAGPDHRGVQQARQPADSRGGRGRGGVVRDPQAPPAGLRPEGVASAACAAHARLGQAGLVLYDVSTLYFEAGQCDGFREPGFSKERRLEPQITIGLLTGQDGFPLMVSAFEGNRAGTKTMLPVIEKFMAARHLPDVTVVADAGMIAEANQKAIEAAGLSFILGMKVPVVLCQVDPVAARAPWRGHPRRTHLHPALARRTVLQAP